MRKKIKFPLIFKDNQPARTMEELREFADVDKLYLYFMNGKLSTWLQDRDYLREAEQIQAVDKEEPELLVKLCEILEIPVPEKTDCHISKNIKAVRHQYEKLNILKQVMDDDDNAILSKLDRIAFNQEELEQIIHRGSQTIYLFDNTFAIPADNCANTFIGIGDNVRIVVEDSAGLPANIDIQNAVVCSSGKPVPLKEEKTEYEYLTETCYNFDGDAKKVFSLEDGTLYTSKYDGLFQRNRRSGEKRLISDKDLSVKAFLQVEAGIFYCTGPSGCPRVSGLFPDSSERVFYFDEKGTNAEIWKGKLNWSWTYKNSPVRYEDNYAIWLTEQDGVCFYNPTDRTLKKLMRNVTLESGRVLLKNNYIYFSRGQMSELMRFDLGTEESFAIMHKIHSFRIYEDCLYIEDYDNLYKVSPENWKPAILSPKHADNFSSSVINYFACDNKFIWTVTHIKGEIITRILDMDLHKIVNTVEYTSDLGGGGYFDMKMDGYFIYIKQRYYDKGVNVKRIDKQSGLIEDITADAYENVVNIL